MRAFLVGGFPEARAEVHGITADEISTVLDFDLHGKQDGPFRGVPSTGRELVLPMTIVCQISDSQIHRLGLYYGVGSLLRELELAL